MRAVNTAPESENKIHDDRVATAYGFRSGLVPGVTVYGYMTLPVIEYFGEEWLERGAMNVRLKAPVYGGEEVTIEARPADEGRLDISLEGGRVTGRAWMERDQAPPDVRAYPERPLPLESARPGASHETLAQGVVLGTVVKDLNLDEIQVSAPLPARIGESDAAHPAVLLNLSNELLIRNVVLGPWIHALSEVTNFSKLYDGDLVAVHGRVIEKYERKGREFVVLDVLVRTDDRVVQRVKHTAIWKLN